ncbi:MAG: hypothetical protein ACFFAX_11105 [Promethearchaeota archaeon]
MPKCPYCSEELRVRLTGSFISEIDDDYLQQIEAFIQRLPRFVRGTFKSQIGRVNEHPPLVNLLVCVYCDSVLSAEIQRFGSNI